MYTQSSTIENAILTAMAVLTIIIFWWAIYAFLLSIFQFIFSKWDAEKVKKAWNNIRYMILWIILSIFLLFIFPIIFQKLQIPWYKVYTAKNIFKKATQLLQNIKSDTSTQNDWWYYTPSSDYTQL